jgi:hypothetical protein
LYYLGVVKKEMITFKVDESLAELIHRVPNKSEFIRQAIMTALENTCPLCQGTGSLNPDQKRHWDSFATHHEIETCDDCQAVHIHCELESPHPQP